MVALPTDSTNEAYREILNSVVSADLQGHIQTLEAAIQAILAKSPSAAAKIAMAEDHMAGTAAVLAKAIAAQKNLG